MLSFQSLNTFFERVGYSFENIIPCDCVELYMSKLAVKLAVPFLIAVILITVVVSASIQTLGLIARFGGLLIGSVVILAYVVVLLYVGLYRGSKKLADVAWGDVFEKHNDDAREVVEEDIPGNARVFVAYSALRVREWLHGNWRDQPSFAEYRDEMVGSLRENIE